MLARYRMQRFRRKDSDPLPAGIRQDTRWRTRHPLRPTREMVETYLSAPSESAWARLKRAYLAELEKRFREDRTPFDKLAELATNNDVFLGCNCPTVKNPDVRRCHTLLALQFMKRKYRKLRVEFPAYAPNKQ